MSLNITFNDLIIAYRKAKADAYFETGHLNAEAFAEYEQNLFENLEWLYEKLLSNNKRWLITKKFTGGYAIILKKLKVKKSIINLDEKIYYSKASRNTDTNDEYELDYRLIGQHPVNFHILSSLWIAKVGFRLEGALNNNSYGCRLKRRYDIETADLRERKSPSDNYSQLGNFKPYLGDYKRWQSNGINSIIKALNEQKKIVAVTTDIIKFYHRIDPNILLEKQLYEQLGIEYLTDAEREFTEYLLQALLSWNQQIFDDPLVPNTFKVNEHCGIPIGLGASKVIANVVMCLLDRQIEREIKPLYYGRYVDDIFIVIEDNNDITSGRDFWQFVAKRIDWIKTDNQHLILFEPINAEPVASFEIPFSSKTLLQFGIGKEKLFFLEGSSGESFIETLQETLNENSSEWRLLPDEEKDLKDLANEVAKSSSTIDEPVNGLRNSDGISIQRLKFILHLRHFEVMVELLPKTFWITGIRKFFSLTLDFVVSVEKIAIFQKYFSSLIKLTVRAEEPDLTFIILNKIEKSWQLLITKAGNNLSLIYAAKAYNDKLLREAVIMSYRIERKSSFNGTEWTKIFQKMDLTNPEILERSEMLFYSDLHCLPFKKIITDKKIQDLWQNQNLFFNESVKKYESEYVLKLSSRKAFLRRSLSFYKDKDIAVKVPFSLFFYTRPFNALEITQLFPKWTSYFGLQKFQLFLSLFNIPKLDINIQKTQLANNFSLPPNLIQIDISKSDNDLNKVFALTSFQTNENSWIATVREDDSEPDPKRYSRLFRLINNIISCDETRINYLVLPELSVPRNVLHFIAEKLKSKNISLIAGVEYEINEGAPTEASGLKGFVSNQLVYILNIPTLTSREQISIIQEKIIPAIHEERELFDAGGKMLLATSQRKYLINHAGFFFSGLICNDLLNIDNRYALRGKIDALIVIEWNKDVDMYDSIIKSTSNDLHSFVIQVNNRLYGDTRMRGPYKDSFARDKVIVSGGDLDFFVVTTLEVKELREFQRFHRSPPTPFKPVPTGFLMSEERRQIIASTESYKK